MTKNFKTILVSPHSDDIAYSIGGILLKNFFEGSIILTTVFTISNYSPCIKMLNKEMISKTRYLEDVEFTDKLKIEFQGLNFPDSSLRGYSHRKIFKKTDPTLDPIYADVYNSLLKLIKAFQCKTIVSPMGLGNHIDHNIVSSICNKIAKENNIHIIFYEDLHYASYLTLKQIKVRANYISNNLQCRIINITPKISDKINNLQIYKTQTNWIFQSKIKFHAILINLENMNIKEMVCSNKILIYLLFLFLTNRKMNIPLYERIWYMQQDGHRTDKF